VPAGWLFEGAVANHIGHFIFPQISLKALGVSAHVNWRIRSRYHWRQTMSMIKQELWRLCRKPSLGKTNKEMASSSFSGIG
jgi:hypothetical protein